MPSIDMIQKIEKDINSMNKPFDMNDLPEVEAFKRVNFFLDNFLTLGTSINYNRNADQLWKNCLELYNKSFRYFASPEFYNLEDLEFTFEEIGFRYYNRDAKGWYKNHKIIENTYGSVKNMVKKSNYDGPKLVQEIKNSEFLYLKGDKLAPFYVKLVDRELYSLDKMWEIDIPVDTHIRRLSKELIGKENISDDEIRAWWRQKDCSRMVVDTGLWLIGNNWDSWGEDYWTSLKQEHL